MELSRSYGAVMAQLWRSYRAVVVGSFVVSRETTRMCRVVVAVGWFVSSDWVLAQLSRRYRGMLVRVLTDTWCTIWNTYREDSNTWCEIWTPNPSHTTLWFKRVSRTYRAVIAQLT